LILLINEAGKVAGCDVLTPSGIPALDIMGCQVIRSRAKFTPAVDANGKPVRSTVVTPPIVWSP
jgi:periplasmic protein TonB